MRVLILGKNGMLGRDMETAFHDMDYISLGRDELDITDHDAVLEKFAGILPDVVVNCTGYTNVDKAEEEEEKANEINGYAVGVLAKACREADATLVHFSTDYVFRGDQKNGYNEDDGVSPVNAYGRSKVLGEQLIFDEMDSLTPERPKEGKYYLIRTSWLFGVHGKNFVETMLGLADEKDELKVVDDQFGKPTFTYDLAQQARWLVLSHEYPTGIYHITNEGETTWKRFAEEIFRLSQKDVTVLPCTTDEFPRAAKRPAYSVLRNNMLPMLRTWKEALADYLEQREHMMANGVE